MKPGAWIAEIQRKPWRLGARGPDAFDCYGLLYWVKRTYFGQEVPRHLVEFPERWGSRDVGRIIRENLGRWQTIDAPVEGCGVGLSKFSSGIIHHCGLWTDADGGLVVHSARAKAGVLCQTVDELRREGYKKIEFFDYFPEDSDPCQP